MAGSFRGASTHRSVRDTLPRRFHAACVALCILLSGFANAASSNSGSSSASVRTATTTTTTTTTSITAAAIITDTRGPPGRRHNYWWWLALGVSGILILFLLLLLFLSWCCCARHQRRRSRAHGSDRQQQRREQQREPQGHDKRPSDGSGGTFSVSPDNFTTRNGSHETDDGRQPDEAAVAISNYVNTTANHPKSTLNQFGYDDVDAAGHDHHRSGDGSSPVKKRIFLAGGWRSSKPTKSKSTSSRSSSKSRKHASLKTTSPPPAAATATSPARGTDASVAVWTNKPRTSATTNRTNPAAAAPPPPLSALARSTSPIIEHLPPVDAASGEADLRTPNPLCPPPVPSSAAQALPETTETPPMVVIGAAGVAAGTPLMRSPAEQAMAPPVRVQQQQQPASPSPERVVDVPLVPAAKTNNAARNTAEQQLQLAKSPMRSSVKPRNITTSHRSPTREITQGASKQYFFGYDRKPTAQNQHNGHNRGAGSSPSDGGSSDRGVVEADRQPSPVPPPQPPHQRHSPTSSPPPQQQQQQQQPQTSTLQLRQSPTPPSDGARLTPLPQRATPPQPQPQPSTSPAQPMPLSSSNAAAASAGPPPRPASASSPFTSQQFSPLRLAGLETEAPANTAVAAVVAAGPLVVSSDRPPRHEHASPHPRIPQQQQQGQQRDVTASSRPPLTPTALHATSNTTTAGPASGGHYTSSGSVKKRIELFRKDSTKKHSPSPPHGRGRSGSAPAAVHGGRPPIPTTATTTQAVPLTSVTTNSAAARNTPSTVTKGVPQLFFGKRDTSPSRAAASKPRAASAHQRPPRPSSGQPRGYPTHINGFPGRTGSGSDLRLSAAQLSQPSAAALLPSHGNTSSASAAAALLGGGGSGPHHPTGTGTPIHSGNATQLNSATPANRFGSSRQTSPSHYGSVTSSMNGGGGNSPSRTSLSRVRSTSRVKFLDEDGVSVSTTGEREVRPTAEGSASAHPATTSPTAAPTQATTSTTTATAVAAGGTGAGGVAAGSTMSREGHGGAPLTSPKLSTTVPSASQRGSGSVLKGRPLAAGLARGGHGGLSAQRETLPDLPPAPATAQVLIEQGRRTAAPMSMPHGAATDSLGAPPQRTTSPARQRPASNRAASPETATPPFSTRTEAPLQMPLRTGVPAVLTPPTPALTPAPMQPPPTQRQTSPNNGSGRHNNNGQHNTAAGSGPVSPPLRAQAARTRRDISPVRPANDELASMSSDASTIPAGMLADPKARDRHAATAAAANAVQQQQQQQQQLQQQRTQSPSQQPPFSTVSPYSSARHILPRGGATVNTSQSPHPSGISVLRITQASGDVQLMPPPTSSQHNRSGAAFGNMRGAAEEEDEDVHVVNSYSRFASGNLASAGVSGGGSTQVRESGAGLPLHRPNIPADTTPSSGAHYSSSTRRNVSPHYSSSSRSNGAARSAGGGGGNRAGLGGGSATNRFGSATSAHRRAN